MGNRKAPQRAVNRIRQFTEMLLTPGFVCEGPGSQMFPHSNVYTVLLNKLPKDTYPQTNKIPIQNDTGGIHLYPQ